MPGNSVVQDHLGDLRFKQARYEEAVAAWERALAGDGETVQRADIEKKLREARARLPEEMTRPRLAAAPIIFILVSACGPPPRPALPTGAGVPFPGFSSAYDQAIEDCKSRQHDHRRNRTVGPRRRHQTPRPDQRRPCRSG